MIILGAWGLFLESPGNFSGQKAALCLPRLHWSQSFNNFENI